MALTRLCLFFLLLCGCGGGMPPGADRASPVENNKTVRPAAPAPLSSYSDLSLTFIGDIMAHRVITERGEYEEIFKSFRDVFISDDLTFANLEFVCDPEKPESGYPLFNAHPEYIMTAAENGIDCFSLANNHIGDMGPESLERMISIMDELSEEPGIYYSGAKKSKTEKNEKMEDRWDITSVTAAGWNIGFIAVTSFLNAYRVRHMVYLLEPEDKETLDSFLSFLKEKDGEFDLLILSYHGGKEYSTSPDREIRELFYSFLSSGADIVWGHHPHVLQQWEIAQEKLILYSTGNFISGQTWNIGPDNPDPERAYTGESAVFRIEYRKTKEGRSVIHSLDPILTANYKHPDYGMIVRPMETLAIDKTIPVHWREYFARRVPFIRELVRGRGE